MATTPTPDARAALLSPAPTSPSPSSPPSASTPTPTPTPTPTSQSRQSPQPAASAGLPQRARAKGISASLLLSPLQTAVAPTRSHETNLPPSVPPPPPPEPLGERYSDLPTVRMQAPEARSANIDHVLQWIADLLLDLADRPSKDAADVVSHKISPAQQDALQQVLFCDDVSALPAELMEGLIRFLQQYHQDLQQQRQEAEQIAGSPSMARRSPSTASAISLAAATPLPRVGVVRESLEFLKTCRRMHDWPLDAYQRRFMRFYLHRQNACSLEDFRQMIADGNAYHAKLVDVKHMYAQLKVRQVFACLMLVVGICLNLVGPFIFESFLSFWTASTGTVVLVAVAYAIMAGGVFAIAFLVIQAYRSFPRRNVPQKLAAIRTVTIRTSYGTALVCLSCGLFRFAAALSTPNSPYFTDLSLQLFLNINLMIFVYFQSILVWFSLILEDPTGELDMLTVIERSLASLTDSVDFIELTNGLADNDVSSAFQNSILVLTIVMVFYLPMGPRLSSLLNEDHPYPFYMINTFYRKKWFRVTEPLSRLLLVFVPLITFRIFITLANTSVNQLGLNEIFLARDSVVAGHLAFQVAVNLRAILADSKAGRGPVRGASASTLDFLGAGAGDLASGGSSPSQIYAHSPRTAFPQD